MSSIAIMQPYFLPYIGYFQLMNAVDKFVIYDNIQYTKKGWINRNRILVNGTDEYITLPLKKDSDYLNVIDRYLSDDFENSSGKLLRKIESVYKKSPEFNNVFPIIEKILKYEEKNLFHFILNSIKNINEYLGIETEIIVSSTLNIDHSFRSQQKVIQIVNSLSGKQYINPIGGMELYDKKDFALHDISLNFIKTREFRYPQYNNDFIPFLSILDVLMFNTVEQTKIYLEEYDIL